MWINITKVESSALSEESLGNGDIEVFSTLIPIMKDVYALKICRLVCKSWNQFACRALRKLPRVYYPVDEDHPQKTQARLNLIVDNVNSGLPSPFRNFKLHITSFRDKYFLRFLKILLGSADDCCLDLHIRSNDADHAEFQAILAGNQENVKITRITLLGEIIEEDESGGKAFQPEVIRLPFLTSLRILDKGLTNDSVVVLCENLCRYSPLQTLILESYTNGDKLTKLMSSIPPMKSFERFFLTCEDPLSLEDWTYVCARIMEFPSIRSLKLEFPDQEPRDDYYAEYVKVIAHFSNSIEALKGHLPCFPNPFFPKLRELNGPPIEEFANFPIQKYPALRKLILGTGNNRDFYYPSCVDTSPGIEELCFISHLATKSDLVLKFITSAGLVFPNVQIFSLHQANPPWAWQQVVGRIQFTTSMLSIICQSFPKLTALDLGVNLKNDRALSGLRLIVDEWLAEGWSLEKIPRETSLLDFTGLEKLTLGPHVIISKHMFLYCLSKIPKLQYLTFYLNGQVTAVDVRDSVGHLTRIEVLILESTNPRKHWVEEMECLRAMLPAVVEIKKKREDFCNK